MLKQKNQCISITKFKKNRIGDSFVISKCQFCFNKKLYIYKKIKNRL